MSNITKFNYLYCRLQQDNYLVCHVRPSLFLLNTIFNLSRPNMIIFDYSNSLYKYTFESEILSFNFTSIILSTMPIYGVCSYNSIMWAIVIVQWIFSITFTHNFIAILAAQLLPQHSLSLNWIDFFQK